MLLSGDIHYARSQPLEQDQALDRLVEDSLNTVQTYVFWSLHEPSPDVFCWGRIEKGCSLCEHGQRTTQVPKNFARICSPSRLVCIFYQYQYIV